METILFDPSVDQLRKIVAATSKITADDLSDDVQLALVHDTRISLRDARVKIEKTGKALRSDALKYQKDVIAREKELLGIILPEEDRLADIEHQANQIKEREARRALLPMRKEQLVNFKDVIDDEAILLLDNDQFVAYLVELQGKKNEADRLEIENEKKRLAEEAYLAQVRKDAEVAERNRIEEAQRVNEQARINAAAQKELDAKMAAQKLIDDAKAEVLRIQREEADKIEKEKMLKIAADIEARARKEKQEADHKYQTWLGHIGWKEGEEASWLFETTPAGVSAYKLVDTFKKTV